VKEDRAGYLLSLWCLIIAQETGEKIHQRTQLKKRARLPGGSSGLTTPALAPAPIRASRRYGHFSFSMVHLILSASLSMLVRRSLIAW